MMSRSIFPKHIFFYFSMTDRSDLQKVNQSNKDDLHEILQVAVKESFSDSLQIINSDFYQTYLTQNENNEAVLECNGKIDERKEQGKVMQDSGDGMEEFVQNLQFRGNNGANESENKRKMVQHASVLTPITSITALRAVQMEADDLLVWAPNQLLEKVSQEQGIRVYF